MAGRPRRSTQAMKKKKYAIICTDMNGQQYYLRDVYGIKIFSTYEAAIVFINQHTYIPFCTNMCVGCIYV